MPYVHLLCDVRARHVDYDSLRMCCTLDATVRVSLNLVYLRFDKFPLQSEIYKARTGNGRFFVKGFLPQISDDSFRYLTRLFLKLFRQCERDISLEVAKRRVARSVDSGVDAAELISESSYGSVFQVRFDCVDSIFHESNYS